MLFATHSSVSHDVEKEYGSSLHYSSKQQHLLLKTGDVARNLEGVEDGEEPGKDSGMAVEGQETKQQCQSQQRQ